jgi:uncharacterized protein YpuA (DUF1002 family)
MRKAIVVVIVLVAAGYAVVQASAAYKKYTDLTERVKHQLDFVDESTTNTVRQEIIRDAGKMGINLQPTDIGIVYEDTEQRSVAQQIVGNRLGTQFVNKRIAISVHYTAHILGIPLNQIITQSEIRQVGAPRMPMRSEERQLLDPTGASALPAVQ